MNNKMTAFADLDVLARRGPVVIASGVITAGRSRSSFAIDDPSSVLTAYLHLIRSMRRQKRAPEIALRRDDIEALARHLDVSSEEALDRLAALMGATAAQRSALASMFATGALVVGLAAATAATFVGLPTGQAAAAAAAPLPADAAADGAADASTEGFVYDIGTPAGYPDAADLATDEGFLYDIGTPAGYPDASDLGHDDGVTDDIGTPAGYPDAPLAENADGVVDDIGTPAGYPEAPLDVPVDVPAADLSPIIVQPAVTVSLQPAVRVPTHSSTSHSSTVDSPDSVTTGGAVTHSDPRRPHAAVDGVADRPVDAAGRLPSGPLAIHADPA